MRLLIALFLAGIAISGASSAALDSPTTCLVCGELHDVADYPVEYRGQTLHLDRQECLDHFNEAARTGALDPFTARIEPRAMLFQQDSNASPVLSSTYFGVGLFVLVGLTCGGLAAVLAIQKGLPARTWFVVGFLLNVLGVMAVIVTKSRATTFSARGCSKEPLTRAEAICPECGHANHPSATRCLECGTTLTPDVASEVELARRTGS